MASSDLTADPGTPGHPAPQRRHVAGSLLLLGLLAAPAAWLAQTVLNYMIASRACYPHDAPLSAASVGALYPMLVVTTLAALLIGIAGLIASRRAWLAMQEERRDSSGHHAREVAEGRTRFLALSGMMASSLFIAAVLFDAVSLWVVPPCG
jgi:hypothetical protein